MAKRSQHLGELELEVMKVVWEHQPCTVQEVAGILAQRRGSARTTVLTIMQRLCGKGFLKRRKRQGIWQYWAAEERGKVLSVLIRRFMEKVLDHAPAPIVAYLVESADLTPDQIAALREIIRQLERRHKEAEP